MKAVIVNSHDSLGGAALAAKAVFEALNTFSSFETFFICQHKGSNDPKISPVKYKKKPMLYRACAKALQGIVTQTIGLNYWHSTSAYLLEHPFLTSADIINPHNIHVNYFAYPVLQKLHAIAPVVITMQDMWYLTGHCAYTYNCTGFITGCRKCPHPEWYPAIKHDTAHFHAEKKRALFEKLHIPFISCSKWLIKEAQKSYILKGRTFHHIHNPIQTDLFYPLDIDKTILKKAIGVPEQKNIICFGAHVIDDPRKGLLKFIETLDPAFVNSNNLFLVIMGKEFSPITGHIPTFIPCKYFGAVDKHEWRNIIYNACDVFIFPTLADDLPNMLLETLSSGTPAVTFNVGGNNEVIQSHDTGYLADYNDYEDFKKGISDLLQNQNLRKEMSHNARKMIMNNFSYKICAQRYENVFSDVIKQWNK